MSLNSLNLILASDSSARKQMLTDANLNVSAVSPKVNERELKQQYILNHLEIDEMAQQLAIDKAKSLAADFPNQLIIGCDQICHMDGKIFNKPKTEEKLTEHLKEMSGNNHHLTSAVAVIYNDDVVMSKTRDAKISLYELSDEDIKAYIQNSDAAILKSAGGYHFETTGSHIIAQTDGDFFTIMGMPLMDLVGFLRRFEG